MQILWLCRKVRNEEWSGVLFYSTKGEFGEKDFSVKAEELFLMDIGNSTYTTYKPNDPLLIQHLMKNPQLMLLRMGHIHSHHTMSVFFSGTDKDELIDNSPFHNYYLSLIVNNSNHMDARVAFKAEVYKEEKTITKFRGTDGALKEKCRSSESNEEFVYSYECEIGYEGDPEELFQSRFQEIQQQHQSKSSKSLFQTAGEYEERSSLFSGTKTSGGLWVPTNDIVESNTGEESSEATRPIRKMVYSLIAKLVSLDSAYRGDLEEALSKRNDAFFGPKKWRHDFDSYCENIKAMAVRFYKYMFHEDKKLTGLSEVMAECIQIMDLYERDFPEMVEGIVDALSSHIQKTTKYE